MGISLPVALGIGTGAGTGYAVGDRGITNPLPNTHGKNSGRVQKLAAIGVNGAAIATIPAAGFVALMAFESTGHDNLPTPAGLKFTYGAAAGYGAGLIANAVWDSL